jgi:hemoglobin/transferrin/lactoferrin receptor protein
MVRWRPGARALLCGTSTIAMMVASAPLGAQEAQRLDPITIIATKTEERATETLASVSTIRQEQIDQLMPSRTSDIFFGMPSVWFQERADDPGTAINIRGMQDFGRVAVVVDGARQNFQRTGHNADGLFYLEPELLAGADVVRGPVANIYGSGAIGGVVSFRTKDVDDILRPGERWGVLTHGMIGSNLGQGLLSAFGAARPNPNVEALAGATYRDRANYQDGNGKEVPNSAYDVATGLGKVTFRPAEGHEVKFSGLAYETNFTNGLPNATRTATVYDTNVQNYIATGKWRYAQPDDYLFNFDGSVYWTETKTSQTKVEGTNNSPSSGSIGDKRSFRIDTVGVDAFNTSHLATGPINHLVTVGADAFQDRVSVVDPTGTGDLFTPSGERTVAGAFVQLKSKYSTWLEVIGAARYDSYRLSGGSTSSNGERVSPKATVGLTPVPWFTVYGTYAEGYRAPAITEVFVDGRHPNVGPGSNFDFLQNPLLRPEVGKTKEVGINIRQDNLLVAGDALRFKANAFQNDVTDFIELAVVGFGQPGVGGRTCLSPAFFCVQYQNVPSARIRGVEFEGMYDAGSWFLGLAGSKLDGDNLAAGVPLLKIPPAQIATTLGARFYDRKVTVAMRWLAVAAKNAEDIPPGSTGGPSLPPTEAYNLVNLYIDYRPTEDVVAGFAIENVFNEQYARYLDVATQGSRVVASPGPGITFKGSVKIRFGAS